MKWMVENMKCGRKICFDPGAHKNTHVNDERITNFIKQSISTDARCVDIGANIGALTLFLSTLTQNSIYAIEPVDYNFALLQFNTKTLTKLSNVHPIYCGLGDKSYTASLYGRGGGYGNCRAWYRKKMRKKCGVKIGKTNIRMLDDIPELMSAPIDFVKMDVQGMELKVLQGASRFIKKNPNCLYISEFQADDLRGAGSSAEQYLDFLRKIFKKVNTFYHESITERDFKKSTFDFYFCGLK